MAITRLTDIITVFKSKWTYGDVRFGYEGEVNQEHDTIYPLMLIQPPSSIIPLIYDGREEYEFEINFYNLYSQAAQDVVTLQQRWDNLQDLSNEWLDMVLKYYQDVTVEAYLNDESIEIERLKDVANDKLVQIKYTFTISAFTKCFRPVSIYPSDFSDLLIWLRADSGATFDIATKKVSHWDDQTTHNNDVSQSTAANKPTRHGYGGGNNKAYFNFTETVTAIELDDIGQYLTSPSNCPIPAEFTMFQVSMIRNAKTADVTLFGYTDGDAVTPSSLKVGANAGSLFSADVEDGSGEDMNIEVASSDTNYNHIGVVKLSGTTLSALYYDATQSLSATQTNIDYDTTNTFKAASFHIGSFVPSSPSLERFLTGQVQEVMVYGRALSAGETADVVSYLNLKYNIY